MSGQVKFSSMPIATSVNADDRLPILVPSSTLPNKTVSVHTLFDGINVDVRTTAKMIHTQTPDIVSGSTSYSANSKYCLLDVNGSTATVNLMSGEEGQELILIAKTLVSDCYFIPVSKRGFSSIRFSSVGSTCHLIYLDGAWNILSFYNVTII